MPKPLAKLAPGTIVKSKGGGFRPNSGGARPNSGPKKMDLRIVLAEIAAYEINGRHASVVAFERLCTMLNDDVVDGERVKLCRIIVDRQLGKPRESVDVKVDRSTTAMDALDAAAVQLAVAMTSKDAIVRA